MKIRIVSLLLLSPLLLGAPKIDAQTNDNHPTNNYPTQGRAGFTLNATISSVDADRDRIVVLGDDDRRYTIDTYKSEIALRDSRHAGETGDLVRGMRVSIAGRLLSSDIVSADRVQVLSLNNDARRQPRPTTPQGDEKRIELRGTVTTVDARRGRFAVDVNHRQRTVFVDDDTEFRGADANADETFPVRTGDRVTVTGQLRADGSVDADRLTRGDSASARPEFPTAAVAARTIIGRVSGTSDKYLSRDLKIRLDEAGREIKILVPKGIPIQHDGRALSVHELTKNDIVRVSGARDGDNFRASRIEVVDSLHSDDRDDF